jgi:hypothetical protein
MTEKQAFARPVDVLAAIMSDRRSQGREAPSVPPGRHWLDRAGLAAGRALQWDRDTLGKTSRIAAQHATDACISEAVLYICICL